MQAGRARSMLIARERTTMTWTVHEWEQELGVGSIESPHFGPIPFDREANADGVQDFHRGEPVSVELDGTAPSIRVRTVRPMRQRQPTGTHSSVFDNVNYRFGDALIEERTQEALQIWLGDCCSHCTPEPLRVRFERVACTSGLDEDIVLEDVLFRLASPEEIRERELSVPAEATAFCLVTSHGAGRDGPVAFVVAQSVRVISPDATAKAT